MRTKEEKYICHTCGQSLVGNNVFLRADGVSARCKECEEMLFEKLESEMGTHLALYALCMSANVPFFPLILPDDEELTEKENRWIYYNELLREKGYFEKNGKILGFFDGATNILKIFGRNLSEKDTAQYIRFELERLKNLPGTPEQREIWGVEDEYTTEDYNALDRMFENRENAFKGQTLTPQMEYTLREVAKWQLLADKLRREKDISGASSALKTVDNLLASECLRKKDEKPVEAFRLDAQIAALEKAGLVENGKFLNLEQTIKRMRDATVKKRKYDYSLDVADQMLFDFQNNMRANADLFMLSELPADLKVEDEYGEFSPVETEIEKKNKHFAGLTKINHAPAEDEENK